MGSFHMYNSDLSDFLLVVFPHTQKYAAKSIALEEAVKLIQIAERARQGRLRALFMKQIFLQECRAKEMKLLGHRLLDTKLAALQIQKVRTQGRGIGAGNGASGWVGGGGGQATCFSLGAEL